MSDSSLPPPEYPEGSADEGKDRPGAFDDFVNKDLDLSGLENSESERSDPASPDPIDRSYMRPLNPFPFPTQKSEDSPYGNLPGRASSSDDDVPRSGFAGLGARLSGLFPPSAPIPRVPPPNIEDSRWIRGVYRVQRDLRIYKSPHRSAPRICTLPEANRRVGKSLRFIANVSPGWSAVHLVGEQPIIGFVDNSEVQLLPRRGLRDIWEDMALIVVLSLLVLALVANLDQLPFLNAGDEARITELEETIQAQQIRIDELESTLEGLQSDRLNDTLRGDDSVRGGGEIGR